MKPTKVTVKTVAERAGVSVASVSRVLNGMSARSETIARVEAAVRELQYVPTVAARSLKLGQTMQLACAFADIGNPVYVSMIKSIEAVAARAGYRLVIHSTNSDQATEEEIVHRLALGYADGLIISPLAPTEKLLSLLNQCPKPVVVIGRIDPSARVDTVRIDSREAARMAVSHLVDQGCRRVAFINGPSDTTPGNSRLEGFTAEAEARGLDFTGLMIAADAFDFSNGYLATHQLLDGNVDFDGLFCAADTLAVGAIRALQERGITPPQIRVASIDNTPLAALSTPPLTSVDLRASERSAAAARLLLDRLADPDLSPQVWTAQPRLVVRDSTSMPTRQEH